MLHGKKLETSKPNAVNWVISFLLKPIFLPKEKKNPGQIAMLKSYNDSMKLNLKKKKEMSRQEISVVFNIL